MKILHFALVRYRHVRKDAKLVHSHDSNVPSRASHLFRKILLMKVALFESISLTIIPGNVDKHGNVGFGSFSDPD